MSPSREGRASARLRASATSARRDAGAEEAAAREGHDLVGEPLLVERRAALRAGRAASSGVGVRRRGEDRHARDPPASRASSKATRVGVAGHELRGVERPRARLRHLLGGVPEVLRRSGLKGPLLHSPASGSSSAHTSFLSWMSPAGRDVPGADVALPEGRLAAAGRSSSGRSRRRRRCAPRGPSPP